VELIAETRAVTVAGNHDLIALGRLDTGGSIPLARESLAWTRDVLRPAAVRYLEALPLRAQAPGGVTIAHGSLDDPSEYIRRPDQAARQLERLAAEDPGVGILILGHTHQQWMFTARPEPKPQPSTPNPQRPMPNAQRPTSVPLCTPLLLNPGSVGQSRDRFALARFLVLDLERQEAVFHAVPYDAAGCREALRRRGLPGGSCHLYRTPVERYARGALRLLRTLARGRAVSRG
jgi:predicted phosphodiesterase